MWYMIYSRDFPDTLALRQQTRPQHLARVSELQQQGRLLVAGPLPAIDSENPGDAGFTGSLLIAQFESLAAAEQWASEDPYKTAGVYQNSIVKPFKKVMP